MALGMHAFASPAKQAPYTADLRQAFSTSVPRPASLKPRLVLNHSSTPLGSTFQPLPRRFHHRPLGPRSLIGPFRFSVSRHQWVIRNQQDAYDHQGRRKLYDDGLVWDIVTKEWIPKHSGKFYRSPQTGAWHAFNDHLEPPPVKEVTDQMLEDHLTDSASLTRHSPKWSSPPLTSSTIREGRIFFEDSNLRGYSNSNVAYHIQCERREREQFNKGRDYERRRESGPSPRIWCRASNFTPTFRPQRPAPRLRHGHPRTDAHVREILNAPVPAGFLVPQAVPLREI
ncbi:hypothetical protein SARC_10428 [Sphaeroforma arctica JP610]|uniref:Uncharacterized protein n=1 Tax=Sphaeroforma arctica JP610 TaxID=667725 RepID=A0A0L0FK09_9EUKA|nr:hypothetical protein SARC_10428 [Sphaeroforma arctica JP610]KNC77104.1 hypothetical protein SARC_10428 [Sphaeroforma arctica JP610]|eukprot:XP_014151006.1 hypothetical protein SARC_10428 [Sphaeroforma arctica JP610]